MKLVIDLRMINVSGIGTYLKNIIPLIVERYNDIEVLGNAKELQSFAWAKDLKIIEFNEKIYSIKEQFEFPKVIPTCDIFWCPHFNVPLLPIKAKKIITTIYDVNHLSGINKSSFLKEQYAKVLYKNATKKSDTIITISEFSKAEIIKYTHVNSNKIQLIYCGVNQENFSKQNIEVEQLQLPKKYILYVGNVKPHKNLITLLKAYSILSNEFKNQYKIVIVGKKEGFITKENEIFEFIDQNNLKENIFFTGYIQDNQVPNVYKKASLFVFPSMYEGFGLPILEAMCCNIPVISSDAASLKEVGGDAVEYFSPLDYKQLATKIQIVLQNPTLQNQLISKGKLQIEKFSWQTAIVKHIAVFDIFLL